MFNKDVHHRQSIRLRGYDYSQPRHYFLTLCCNQKKALFGDISQHHMQLNSCGEIATAHWLKISVLQPSVKLHEFVIMPNHMHAIIEIKPTDSGYINTVLLGQMVRGYKASVTSAIRKQTQNQVYAVWQRNYYEHIIRNEASFWTITQYIQDNPKKWNEDDYFVK